MGPDADLRTTYLKDGQNGQRATHSGWRVEETVGTAQEEIRWTGRRRGPGWWRKTKYRRRRSWRGSQGKGHFVSRAESLEYLWPLEISTVNSCLLAADRDDPGRQVWYDLEGSVTAVGYSAGGAQWLRLPGVATFRLNPGLFITAFPDAGTTREMIEDSYRRTALPLALQARGMEVLHGSGVAAPAGVVAICGRSTMGKSTLAYGLSRRGFALWSDDAIAVRRSDAGIMCLPLPAAIRLRRSSRTHFEADGATVPAGVLKIPSEPLPLAAIVVIQRTSAAPDRGRVSIERIAGARGLRELLPHAYSFSLSDRSRKQLMLRQYAGLAASTPVFRLEFGTGLELLPAVLDTLETHVLNRNSVAP